MNGQPPEHFLALLREVEQTFRRKNAGYAGKASEWDANFRAVNRIGVSTETGLMVRIFDKWERLCNLWDDSAADQTGESIEDTELDMANYLLILLTVQRERRDQLLSKVPQPNLTKHTISYSNDGNVVGLQWLTSTELHELRSAIDAELIVPAAAEVEVAEPTSATVYKQVAEDWYQYHSRRAEMEAEAAPYLHSWPSTIEEL